MSSLEKVISKLLFPWTMCCRERTPQQGYCRFGHRQCVAITEHENKAICSFRNRMAVKASRSQYHASIQSFCALRQFSFILTHYKFQQSPACIPLNLLRRLHLTMPNVTSVTISVNIVGYIGNSLMKSQTTTTKILFQCFVVFL